MLEIVLKCLLRILESISFKFLAKIFGGLLALEGRLIFRKKFSFNFVGFIC